MSILAIAFSLAWGVVGLFLGWLAYQNRRLVRRLEKLETAALDKQGSRRHARAA